MKNAGKHTRQRPRFLVPVVGALLLGLGTTACSTQERNYEIPSTMCGMAVSPDLTEPLLPPGDKLSTTLSAKAEGLERCLVNVDGEQVLAFNIEWRKKGSNLSDYASVFPGVEPGDRETGDGRYLYSETGAVGKVNCPKPQKTSGDLFVATRVANSGKPDEAAMKKLIAAYAETVGKSDECT